MITLVIGFILLCSVACWLLAWAIDHVEEADGQGIILGVLMLAGLLTMGVGIESIHQEPQQTIHYAPIFIPRLVTVPVPVFETQPVKLEKQ